MAVASIRIAISSHCVRIDSTSAAAPSSAAMPLALPLAATAPPARGRGAGGSWAMVPSAGLEARGPLHERFAFRLRAAMALALIATML